MLALSPLRSPKGDQERDHHAGDGFLGCDDFSIDDNLLDYIDFSCDPFSAGFDSGDILPDLEVDPADLLAEFSSHGEAEDASATSMVVNSAEPVLVECEKASTTAGKDAKEEKNVKCGDEVGSAVTTEDSAAVGSETRSPASAEGDSKRKPSSSSAKNSHGRRKVKVDWTPELHRRFVQAVEQLGIDKAVPSRILEIMGIDCLTRHNIASHLQKYRSHRKHLLAREAEAASWTQKRQMYTANAGGHGGARDTNPWLAPTIGFPHPPPSAHPMVQPFRPLHVWGHPTAVDPSLMHVWPRHLAPQPRPPWTTRPPIPPPPDPSYWHHHYNAARKGWGPQAVTPGTPCIPQPVPPMRFPAPMVPGVFPHPIYRPIPPPPSKHAGLQLQLESHPSKECIDAAIGDVLVKPWLPLPLGLKPPSMDSVMVELQKQGISKVPPTSG